jgi:hypothetical protein
VAQRDIVTLPYGIRMIWLLNAQGLTECWLTLFYSAGEEEAGKQSGTSVRAQGIFCVGKCAILIIVAESGEVIEGCVEDLCIVVVTQ